MNSTNIAIIGTGNVGSSLAYELRHLNAHTHITLFDIDKTLLMAQYLDLRQSLNGASLPSEYRKTDNLSDIINQNVICITAGIPQKPGQSRLELEQQNYTIVQSILHTLIPANPEALYIVLTNPVDVILNKFFSDPTNETLTNSFNNILSTGTLLDTHRLYDELQIDPDPYNYSKQPMILGEHGDTQALYNPTKKLISSNTLSFVKTSAYTIIKGKGYTNYAIATATKKLIDCIINQKNSILPISTYQSFISKRFSVALSLPVLLLNGRVHSIDSQFDNESVKKLVRDSIDIIAKHT